MDIGDVGADEPCWGTVVEIGEELATRGPLQDQWNEALKRAAENCPDEGWFKVETYVLVKRRNPGWVDGFKVNLKPPDS